MKSLLIICTIFSISLFGSIDQDKEIFQVKYKGALKNIMHKGDISAHADLSDYKNIEHFYDIISYGVFVEFLCASRCYVPAIVESYCI